MDRHRTRQLAARFIAEAEADINYGLAEDLDARHEYTMLVARLNGEQISESRISPQCAGAENCEVSVSNEIILSGAKIPELSV
jgi:hypothetical protein